MPINATSRAPLSCDYQTIKDNSTPHSNTASSLKRASNTPTVIEMQLMGSSQEVDIQNAHGPITECNAENSFKSKLITCAKAACVVAGIGTTALGIAVAIRSINGSGTSSSGAIRENSLTHFPKAEPLIDHGNLPGSIFNILDLIDQGFNAAATPKITRESITEFLTNLVVADIDGQEVARDSEIQTKYPEIFNAIEQSRKDAVVYLKNFRDKCTENCDIPLPPVSEGGPEGYLKGFIGWMLEQSTNLTSSELGSATDSAYTNLLSEMNVRQDDFESRDSYTGNRTLIDFLIELAENPCHANNLSRQCIQYVLMEQSAEGLDKDEAANRPPTYAMNTSPALALIESPQVPVVFTTHLANLARYPLLLTHIMVHELIHYAGFNDPLYTSVDNNTLSSNDATLENQIRIYDKTYYEFRQDIATHLDNVPTPFQFVLEEFFDNHIGNQNITYIEKLNTLKIELLNDDVLWDSFANEATDLIAMRIITESRRNGTSPVG